MKVELKEQFNTSMGTVFTIKSSEILSIGDRITIGEEEYTIKGFMHPAGAFDVDIISVIV